MRRLAAVLAMTAAMAATALPVSAQRPLQPKRGAKIHPRPRTQLELLQRMPPDQRRRVLDSLPPERRRALEQRLRQLDSMSPDERRQTRRLLDDFQNLPPERRQAVRRLFAAFNRMPPDRRALLRQEVRSLGRMTRLEREERMSGGDYRARYSELEQRWLDNLTRAVHGN
jgi:hypothetical protein